MQCMKGSKQNKVQVDLRGHPQEFLGGCAEDHFIPKKSKFWRIVDTGINLQGSSHLLMNKR